jgi:hypothetical protein
MTGGAIEIGPIAWALRNGAGTGELSQRLVVDWAAGNRAVLERFLTYNTASQTPTTDKYQLVLRQAEADVGPTVPTFDYSAILSGSAAWLKIALLSDGRTVSYQVADDTKQYVQLATRSCRRPPRRAGSLRPRRSRSPAFRVTCDHADGSRTVPWRDRQREPVDVGYAHADQPCVHLGADRLRPASQGPRRSATLAAPSRSGSRARSRHSPDRSSRWVSPGTT